MLPLLPFAVGIATGALAIKLWRNDKTRETLDNAGARLRQATASGLSRLETSSAAMRERLETEAPVPEAAPAPVEKTSRRRKPATASADKPAKTTPRKRAAKPKADAAEGEAA